MINDRKSNEFVKVAMDNYEKLLQERSEIYKRYFVSIPDLKALGKEGSVTDLRWYKSRILRRFLQVQYKV